MSVTLVVDYQQAVGGVLAADARVACPGLAFAAAASCVHIADADHFDHFAGSVRAVKIAVGSLQLSVLMLVLEVVAFGVNFGYVQNFGAGRYFVE